jgi:hypothetical protein
LLVRACAIFERGSRGVLHDAHFNVDGAHDGADGFELRGVPGGADEAEGSGEHDSVGSPESVGEATGEEAAEGRHAYEGHGVVVAMAESAPRMRKTALWQEYLVSLFQHGPVCSGECWMDVCSSLGLLRGAVKRDDLRGLMDGLHSAGHEVHQEIVA